MSELVATKSCSKCLEDKTLGEFHLNKGTSDGRHIYCAACYNVFKRDSYIRNRETDLARSRAWNKAHYPQVKAAIDKARSEKPEHYREYRAKYRADNPEKVRLWDRNKHMRRRAAVRAGTVTASDLLDVLQSNSGRCVYCWRKSKALTIDHIVPLAKGGPHSVENLAPACRSCNSRKQDNDASNFRRAHGAVLVTESQLVSEILLALSGRGAMAWRNNSGELRDRRGRAVRFGLPGSPDILGVVGPRGKFIGIECKSKTGRQSPQQKKFEQAFSKRGGVYVLARSVEDVMAAVDRIAAADAAG